MRARSCSGIVAIGATAVLVTLSGQGPPPPRRLPLPGRTATQSTAQPVSGVAFTTWVGTLDSAGVSTMRLLVVWRGTPGWFARGSGNGESGGGNGSSYHSTIHRGDLNLQLDFDFSTRVASIQGKQVQLGDDNAILVDSVDGRAGPQVIKTLRVDTAPPATDGFPRIEEVLRRSPEILSFLQCDARLSDAPSQKMADLLCSRIVGK